MLRWQPYKVFDWVWLRHDFTKLKATRQPQHLNSVTRSVSPCLDLFICRLWASPTRRPGPAALYMTTAWLCFGRPVTHSAQNCHSHSPAHRNDTFMRVCLCVYNTPCHSWEKCERHRLWTSWETQDDSATRMKHVICKRSLWAQHAHILEYRCIKIKMQSWVYNSESWQTFSIH